MFESADVEYGVLPFIRDAAGELVPLQPVDASNRASVQYRAESAVIAGRYDGAIAFSRSRDRRSGGVKTAIIAQFGELPESFSEPTPEMSH
ncbi:hypothetical protein ACMDCR_23120 [Labrys okinawensis]|uniref:hypothetical protein n=1 Tax=Labrys okinawensis TaxID=346911 RepID=UPI0039BC8FEB